MTLGRFILKGGKPVPEPDLDKWARWMEESDRRIARDEMFGWVVSTVFLGLDHRFTGSDDEGPLVFETMVFDDEGEAKHQERHTNIPDACVRHNLLVARLRKSFAERRRKRAWLWFLLSLIAVPLLLAPFLL